jgi:hypothetical protein
MRLFSIFRLRRPMRDLTRIATALEELNSMLRAHLGIRDSRLPRATEFGSFDVDAANELWRKEQEAAEYGGVVEEQPK